MHGNLKTDSITYFCNGNPFKVANWAKSNTQRVKTAREDAGKFDIIFVCEGCSDNCRMESRESRCLYKTLSSFISSELIAGSRNLLYLYTHLREKINDVHNFFFIPFSVFQGRRNIFRWQGKWQMLYILILTDGFFFRIYLPNNAFNTGGG